MILSHAFCVTIGGRTVESPDPCNFNNDVQSGSGYAVLDAFIYSPLSTYRITCRDEFILWDIQLYLGHWSGKALCTWPAAYELRLILIWLPSHRQTIISASLAMNMIPE